MCFKFLAASLYSLQSTVYSSVYSVQMMPFIECLKCAVIFKFGVFVFDYVVIASLNLLATFLIGNSIFFSCVCVCFFWLFAWANVSYA